MHYSQEDRSYLLNATSASSSKHVNELASMVERNASYSELFEYGAAYLPRLKNEKTGKTDLEKLNGYVPEIVEFFDVVSELPSLPNRLKDLATDLAIYANGETVQADRHYYDLEPLAEIQLALKSL
jgi:hypothetical protein